MWDILFLILANRNDHITRDTQCNTIYGGCARYTRLVIFLFLKYNENLLMNLANRCNIRYNRFTCCVDVWLSSLIETVNNNNITRDTHQFSRAHCVNNKMDRNSATRSLNLTIFDWTRKKTILHNNSVLSSLSYLLHATHTVKHTNL